MCDFWEAEFERAKAAAEKDPSQPNRVHMQRASKELRTWNSDLARLQLDDGQGKDELGTFLDERA